MHRVTVLDADGLKSRRQPELDLLDNLTHLVNIETNQRFHTDQVSTDDDSVVFLTGSRTHMEHEVTDLSELQETFLGVRRMLITNEDVFTEIRIVAQEVKLSTKLSVNCLLIHF